MHWPKEEVDYLIEVYPTNMSLKDIGIKLRRSRRSVLHKAARLGLSRIRIPVNKPKDPEYRKKIDKKYYLKNREKIYKTKMKRRLRIKREMVKTLGGRCSFCNYNKCVAALEFHHKDMGKEKAVSILIKNSSEQNVLKETKKCILVCANCHRELHSKGTSFNGRIFGSSD